MKPIVEGSKIAVNGRDFFVQRVFCNERGEPSQIIAYEILADADAEWPRWQIDLAAVDVDVLTQH